MGAMSDINIVPLVDVVLVLLVIFMLTAHVLEFGLEIEVPKVKQVRDSAQELPVISLSKSGELYLNEASVNINRLGDEFRRRFPGANAAYVRADRNTIWDPIAQVIGVLGEQKIDVRVVTQPDDGAGNK
jgi:biopolymer transport protein ExbD